MEKNQFKNLIIRVNSAMNYKELKYIASQYNVNLTIVEQGSSLYDTVKCVGKSEELRKFKNELNSIGLLGD
jgi:hypothetical protein